MSDITRSEAIDWLYRLKSWIAIYIPRNKQKCKQALDFAINSLETDETYQLEYEKPEFCENCISKSDALDSINWAYNLSDAYKKINLLPCVLPKADNSVLEDIKNILYTEMNSLEALQEIRKIVESEDNE